MKKRKSLGAVLAAVVLALLLCACGGTFSEPAADRSAEVQTDLPAIQAVELRLEAVSPTRLIPRAIFFLSPEAAELPWETLQEKFLPFTPAGGTVSEGASGQDRTVEITAGALHPGGVDRFLACVFGEENAALTIPAEPASAEAFSVPLWFALRLSAKRFAVPSSRVAYGLILPQNYKFALSADPSRMPELQEAVPGETIRFRPGEDPAEPVTVWTLAEKYYPVEQVLAEASPSGAKWKFTSTFRLRGIPEKAELEQFRKSFSQKMAAEGSEKARLRVTSSKGKASDTAEIKVELTGTPEELRDATRLLFGREITLVEQGKPDGFWEILKDQDGYVEFDYSDTVRNKTGNFTVVFGSKAGIFSAILPGESAASVESTHGTAVFSRTYLDVLAMLLWVLLVGGTALILFSLLHSGYRRKFAKDAAGTAPDASRPRYCGKCGMPLEPGASACAYCGAPESEAVR